MLMICANNNGVLKAPLFPMTLFIQAFAMRHALQILDFWEETIYQFGINKIQ